MQAKSNITPRQKEIFLSYCKTGSSVKTAKEFGISATNVNKALIGYHRNLALDHGYKVPSVNQVLANNGEKTNPCERVKNIIKQLNNLDSLPEAFEDTGELIPVTPFSTGERILKSSYIPFPEKGVDRYILMSAQDSTPVHKKFFENILALKSYYEKFGNCQIFVAPNLYNKGMFGDPARQKRQFLSPRQIHYLPLAEIKKSVFFDELLQDYIIDDAIDFGGVAEFRAEMNTLPTAVNPLSGLENYVADKWGVFPHPKQHLVSIPRIPCYDYRANMTTGACTLPNYIRKKQGMKAEPDHVIGFVVLELDSKGGYYLRHIEADINTGDFRDLDILVSHGEISRGNSVSGISYGDIHLEKIDREACLATFGYDPDLQKNDKDFLGKSLLERLKPANQYMHDILDFSCRNHHIQKDDAELAMYEAKGLDSVEREVDAVGWFLKHTMRDYSNTVLIQSNHNNALTKWAKEGDLRKDGKNKAFWHWLNYHYYTAIYKEKKFIDLFKLALNKNVGGLEKLIFVGENEDYKVNGISRTHGHLGPSGARGTPSNLNKIAKKSSNGHVHGPYKLHNSMGAGCMNLVMGYNNGPTTWAIAHIVEHLDGSRQLVFMNNGKFYADQY